MKVKVINKSNNLLPEYATDGSAGLDLRAFLPDGDIILNQFEQKIIPTGLFFEIPEKTFVMITPRSGLAAKNKITITNSPGVLDESYRGECMVILMNLGQEPFVVKNGDRIAQMILMNYKKVKFEIVEKLSETKRNAGGFGHTGKN